MNGKIILIIIISLTLAVAAVLMGVWGALEYHPEWLGFEPLPDTVAVDTVIVEPVLAISREKLEAYENALLKLNVEKNSKNVALKEKKRLQDSVNALSANMKRITDSLNALHNIIDSGMTENRQMNDSLALMADSLTRAKGQVERVENIAKQQEEFINKKQDSLELENFKTFAKIYNKANPEEVAKILEQLDERDAAIILKNMQTKKAGKVLEAMKPENAAAILLLGIGE